MEEQAVCAVFDALARGDEEGAWQRFLDGFAPVVLQTVRRVLQDEDTARDAFVYVCERFAEDGCRRLRAFDPDRGARFTTWVRALTRNLAIDFRRQHSGRFRPFASVQRLSRLDQLVFRYRHRDRLTLGDTLLRLLPDFPWLTTEVIGERDHVVSAMLTPDQRWRLAAQFRGFEPLPDENEARTSQLKREPSQTAEDALIAAELGTRLAGAMRRLPVRDRWLLQLRYQHGLTLARIAETGGFRNAAQADRHLQAVLARLRAEIDPPPAENR
jgi:RNA polymerase sigma factor (sigma-70 family)